MSSIPQKTCSRCAQTKPLSNFYKGKGYKDGYTGQCKACRDAVIRERNKLPEVREHNKARERARWQRNEHLREQKRNYLRERYRNNPEHKRKQFEYSTAATHRRRARKDANGGSFTAKEWRALCALYDHRCLCCGEAKPLTIDHVVPLVDGGTNDISNIQPLCLDCNLHKSTKTIDYRTLVQLRMEWGD